MTDIATNLAAIQARIEAACARVGRNSDEVTLIAVSKKKPPEDIYAAAEQGIIYFGENRVEESQTKIPKVEAHLDRVLNWHMVGHIQSRKASAVIDIGFDLIHSIDSLKIARRLNKFAAEKGHVQDVLLEINISGEAAKYGWQAPVWKKDSLETTPLWSDFQIISGFEYLNVLGLMTMAPYVGDAEETRAVFRSLAHLRDAITELSGHAMPHLSMGMTNDFEVAIEEGATLVRVGRAIFGERN